VLIQNYNIVLVMNQMKINNLQRIGKYDSERLWCGIGPRLGASIRYTSSSLIRVSHRFSNVLGVGERSGSTLGVNVRFGSAQ
jgi:hypothetical protein